MSMNLTLSCWNVGGANLLRTPPGDRAAVRDQYNRELQTLIAKHDPDVILLQEVVRYGIEQGPAKGECEDLFEHFADYFYVASIAIDTKRNYHPVKWQPIREAGRWAPTTYLAQGLGMLWRRELSHCSMWETADDQARCGESIEKEEVRMEDGLFSGNRDSEPRVVVVSRFRIGDRDVFIINLHLTTLIGEREGFPELDDEGSRIRRNQLAVVLNGVVTRLNQHRATVNAARVAKNLTPRQPALWLLTGDFNAVPDAPEIHHVERMNFARLCDDRATKGKKSPTGTTVPSIKVDYLFAGPQYYAFDPSVLGSQTYSVDYALECSDHFPLTVKLAI